MRMIVDVLLFIFCGGDVLGRMLLKNQVSPAMVDLWLEDRDGGPSVGRDAAFEHYLSALSACAGLRAILLSSLLIGFLVWWLLPSFFVGWVWATVCALLGFAYALLRFCFGSFPYFYPGVGRDFRRRWLELARKTGRTLKTISVLSKDELRKWGVSELEKVIQDCRESPEKVWKYEEMTDLFISLGLMDGDRARQLWRDAMVPGPDLRAAC